MRTRTNLSQATTKRMNVRTFMHRSIQDPRGADFLPSFWRHLQADPRINWNDSSADVAFLYIKDPDGRGRRVVVLSNPGPQDKSLPTLVVAGAGNNTWEGSTDPKSVVMPYTTQLRNLSVAVVAPGGRTYKVFNARPRIRYGWNCVGSWAYGADDPLVQALMVGKGGRIRPVDRHAWRDADHVQTLSYNRHISRLSR